MSEPSDVEPVPYCLVVVRAPAGSPQPPGTVIAVPARGGVLGRAPEADVFLADRSISRRHARIEVDEGGVRVLPMTSNNGTFAAGHRLEPGAPPAFVAVDQRLQVGGVVLCLTSAQETEPVLDPVASGRLEPSFVVTWDAGHCVLQVQGQPLRGITGASARFLGQLAEAEGRTVHHWDLEHALQTQHLAPLATAARRALRDAIEDGTLQRAFVVSRLRGAGAEVPDEADAQELAKAMVENRRGHGYTLHLEPGDVRVVRV